MKTPKTTASGNGAPKSNAQQPEEITPQMVAKLASKLPGKIILVDVNLFGDLFQTLNTNLLPDDRIETSNIAAHQTAAISALYESRVS